MAGLSKEEVTAILDFRSSDRFSAKEKTALEYAERVTLSPRKVSDELVDQLKRHFSEPEIVELTLAIAAYNLTNRFNLALGVDLEPKFEEILASAGIRV